MDLDRLEALLASDHLFAVSGISSLITRTDETKSLNYLGMYTYSLNTYVWYISVYVYMMSIYPHILVYVCTVIYLCMYVCT